MTYSPFLKGILVKSLNYAGENDRLKIVIGRLWGKIGIWGGLAAIQSFCLLKKGHRTFEFRLKESSPDILRSLVWYDHLWNKKANPHIFVIFLLE